MQRRLERKALPSRLAEIIETEIKAGDWSDTLAGHRSLMRRYSVSAKTCLAAIDLLESRGLISGPEQGKKRRILVDRVQQVRTLRDLLIIEGTGAQSGEDLHQINAYHRAWEESGGRVETARFDFPRYRRPESLLREAISSHKADALLLYVAPLAWVDAASKLRPTFLSGGEWQGDGITGVGYDIRDEVARAVGRLKGLGHERILVPMDLVGPRMERAVRQGLARGLGLAEDSAVAREFAPVFPERIPAVWQQYWRKTFSSLRPTALVLLDDIRYISLVGYCFAHGIRIPGDLSVICLESTEHLDWCVPIPTRLGFPTQEAVKRFRKWIRGGCKATGMNFLKMKLIEGQSLASVK
jgi:hypothetical protein